MTYTARSIFVDLRTIPPASTPDFDLTKLIRDYILQNRPDSNTKTFFIIRIAFGDENTSIIETSDKIVHEHGINYHGATFVNSFLNKENNIYEAGLHANRSCKIIDTHNPHIERFLFITKDTGVSSIIDELQKYAQPVHWKVINPNVIHINDKNITEGDILEVVKKIVGGLNYDEKEYLCLKYHSYFNYEHKTGLKIFEYILDFAD